MPKQIPAQQSRRRVLKGLTGSGGLILGAKALPEQWTRPIVNSVVLPVHAQTIAPPPPPLSDACLNVFTGFFPGITVPNSGLFGGTVNAGETVTVSNSVISGSGTHQLESPPGSIVSGPVSLDQPLVFTFPTSGNFDVLHVLSGSATVDITWSCGRGSANGISAPQGIRTRSNPYR